MLVWCNTYSGVHTLASTTVKEERDTPCLSRNIRRLLLAEPALNRAVSLDHDGRYWLSVNGKVFLWDYSSSPYTVTGNEDADASRLAWWYLDNMPASTWIKDSRRAWYGSGAAGRIVKLVTERNAQFYDFGGPIDALYKVPLRDFGGGRFLFDVLKCRFGCRADTRTQINVRYFTDRQPNGITEPNPLIVGSFSFKDFSFANFTFQVVKFAKTFVRKTSFKKVGLIGLELSNADPGRDLSVSGVSIDYQISKEKR
jgi:hypothetical protein